MSNLSTYYGSILQDALHWKFPDKELVCGEDTDSINFVNGDIDLDLSTIPQIISDYEAYREKISYQESRKLNYIRIEDWLDQIWHDIDNGTLDKTGIFYTNRLTIKNQFPKPP